uniref:Uncharacterized protein n=1 Tax=Trichuris muris TaxID=70415 RepID=A0A5S6R0H4_TRIMR
MELLIGPLEFVTENMLTTGVTSKVLDKDVFLRSFRHVMKRQATKGKHPEKVQVKDSTKPVYNASRKSDFRGRTANKNKFIRCLKTAFYLMFSLTALVSVGVWLVLTYGDDHLVKLLQTGYDDALVRFRSVRNKALPVYFSIKESIVSFVTVAIRPIATVIGETITDLLIYYLYLLKSLIIPLLLDWQKLADICYQAISDTVHLMLDAAAMLSLSVRSFFESR